MMLLRNTTSVLFLYLSYFLKNENETLCLFKLMDQIFFFFTYIQDTLAEFSFALSSRIVIKKILTVGEKDVIFA